MARPQDEHYAESWLVAFWEELEKGGWSWRLQSWRPSANFIPCSWMLFFRGKPVLWTSLTAPLKPCPAQLWPSMWVWEAAPPGFRWASPEKILEEEISRFSLPQLQLVSGLPVVYLLSAAIPWLNLLPLLRAFSSAISLNFTSLEPQ